MRKIKMFEALAIRFLWLLYALSPKKKPGLCPPCCSEGHSYRWPCRNRGWKDEIFDWKNPWSFGFNITKSQWRNKQEDVEAGKFISAVYNSNRNNQAKSEGKVILDESLKQSVDEAYLKTGEFIKRYPK